MARRTHISKDVILKAALQLLIEKGYEYINIKTLSAAIGCSTQPIVWYFESMDGLRTALSKYAQSYVDEIMAPSAEDGEEAFAQIGASFIRLALYKPNLFRFLYMSGKSDYSLRSFEGISGQDHYADVIKSLMKKWDITEAQAEEYLQNEVIYTHGIAALAVGQVIKPTEEEIFKKMSAASAAFLNKVRGDKNGN